MKARKIFILIILFSEYAVGQTAYYDAIKIKADIEFQITEAGRISLEPDSNSLQVFNLIFRNYINQGRLDEAKSDSALLAIITEEFKNNPFVIVGTDLQQDANIVGTNGRVNKSFSLISSISSLNVASFADGLAKFLIERAKEELNVAFFEKLKDLSKKYPEFVMLFPNTQTLVNNFASWEYTNIINTLRESFDKDLKQLLFNITQLANLDTTLCEDKDDKCKTRINEIIKFLGNEKGRIFLSSVLLGNGFISGEKLPDVINVMARPNYLGAGFNADFTNSFQLLNVISFSLKSNDFGKSYISEEEFKILIDDPVSRNLYLGLLYQQIKNKNIHFNLFDKLVIINANKDQFINGIKNYVNSILSQTKEFSIALDSLAKAKKRAESDLYPYLATVFESANAFLQTAKDLHIIDPSITLPDEIQIILDNGAKTLQIAHDIAVRNYSAAVIGVLTLMAEKLPANDFTKRFVKYGSFAANVVQAKNSDEVKAAIKAVALPAGSASIKKNSSFNVSLNAYLGGFYGSEYLRESPGRKRAPITGVYAPIGIGTSWGFGKCGSISAFGSIIDIGAFASYRLKDDSTEALPEVSLKNILAPGLGIIYGLPQIPLSIGYTWQYGPMLREIKNTGINASDRPNHRWQFFLSVDIPIVNFYTKVKN